MPHPGGGRTDPTLAHIFGSRKSVRHRLVPLHWSRTEGERQDWAGRAGHVRNWGTHPSPPPPRHRKYALGRVVRVVPAEASSKGSPGASHWLDEYDAAQTINARWYTSAGIDGAGQNETDSQHNVCGQTQVSFRTFVKKLPINQYLIRYWLLKINSLLNSVRGPKTMRISEGSEIGYLHTFNLPYVLYKIKPENTRLSSPRANTLLPRSHYPPHYTALSLLCGAVVLPVLSRSSIH